MQSVALSTVTTRPGLGRSTARATRKQQTRVVVTASSSSSNNSDESQSLSLARRFQQVALSIAAGAVVATSAPGAAMARLEGVNNPQMLPPGPTQVVLDVAGYLTKGEIARLTEEVNNLEKDTGLRLRVLAQAYPNTPGLAIKDYWAVDDNTVVFVADPGLGNILNFAVGAGVDLEVPKNFWTKLANTYGTKTFWQERGESASISNAVSAIDTCFREDPGRFKCGKIQAELTDDMSDGGGFRPFGKKFGKGT
mmetsp:Transcript_14228/g.34236  ORF Transcript_14228/g.34236 Transcript_14228/m.34236 type:complete len:252 (-) Transcript_14228:55-810(-)|eukprot:CAMPEP_0197592158 /NCGR_PEP_ID=MMETSP1326-20131121/14822_1 /TAXON_ID=1155430 /ORGANISM="Genus nov. species nov., Strain RCC2288" /LENGTH=251 /DNA_ID=CAMNT_0043157815 /DNA_START=55 /DNA_END=810 /DNA_ORIENTATION=+